MATHSSILAWKIPWMEEPDGLQSMGSLRVRHDWATSLWLFTFMHWKRKWQPTQVFLPGESQGWGAWWAAVYGITQSWTRLMRFSSSSSRKKHQFNCSVVSDSLQSHGLQHARLPCPSPTLRACSNSCLSSRWCKSTRNRKLQEMWSAPRTMAVDWSI